MWVNIKKVTVDQSDLPVVIDQTFTGFGLIVKAVCYTAKPTWQRAGYLYPEYDITDFGKVTGCRRKIYLNTQLVYFTDANYLNTTDIAFKLSFQTLPWIPQVELTFWQNQ